MSCDVDELLEYHHRRLKTSKVVAVWVLFRLFFPFASSCDFILVAALFNPAPLLG